MSKAIIRLALAVWITSTLSACGTFMNVSERDDISLMRDGPKKVYGGVCWDAGSGGDYLAEVVKPNETLLDRLQSLACGAYLVAIDLPLSIIGDTFTLPFTIAAAVDEQKSVGGIEGFSAQSNTNPHTVPRSPK